jgi:L-threonylcarbamoyladenylate synthase
MTALPFASEAEARAAIPRVWAHLRAGGLLAYPTETVYGLGSRPVDADLRALAALKGRAAGKPFLLLVASREMAEAQGLAFNESARALARAFWPGPLTLVLPGGSGRLPDLLRGPEGGIAVRWTSHPGVALLVAEMGPLIHLQPGVPPAGATFCGRAWERLRATVACWASAAFCGLHAWRALAHGMVARGGGDAGAVKVLFVCTGTRTRCCRSAAEAALASRLNDSPWRGWRGARLRRPICGAERGPIGHARQPLRHGADPRWRGTTRRASGCERAGLRAGRVCGQTGGSRGGRSVRGTSPRHLCRARVADRGRGRSPRRQGAE